MRTETSAVNARILASGSSASTIGVLPDDMNVTRSRRRPTRQQEADEAAQRREDDVLDQQLADEPPSAGAECQAHRELRQPRRRAGEHEVGDIGAGNQQDDRDDRHQDEERLRELLAQVRNAGCGGAEAQLFWNDLGLLAGP